MANAWISPCCCCADRNSNALSSVDQVRYDEAEKFKTTIYGLGRIKQAMPEPACYQYLQPKRGSRYPQLAVSGRIRAEILYRETLGPEPLSPEQVAKEYNIPVEAVLEAIHYCEHNRALLDSERAREQATIEARGFEHWPHAPQAPEPAR
jgi:hypothetical protein